MYREAYTRNQIGLLACVALNAYHSQVEYQWYKGDQMMEDGHLSHCICGESRSIELQHKAVFTDYLCYMCVQSATRLDCMDTCIVFFYYCYPARPLHYMYRTETTAGSPHKNQGSTCSGFRLIYIVEWSSWFLYSYRFTSSRTN